MPRIAVTVEFENEGVYDKFRYAVLSVSESVEVLSRTSTESMTVGGDLAVLVNRLDELYREKKAASLMRTAEQFKEAKRRLKTEMEELTEP